MKPIHSLLAIGSFLLVSASAVSSTQPRSSRWASAANNLTWKTEQKAAMIPGFAKDVDCFADANRYQITAQLLLEANAAVIRGEQQVRYSNRSAVPLREIVFRLYPNIPSLRSVAQMQVTAAKIKGKPVQPVLSDQATILSLPLAEELPPGQSVEITLNFVTRLQRNKAGAGFGRMGYINGVITGGSWYPTLSVYETGSGWWKASIPPAILNQNGAVELDSDPTYTETGLYQVQLTVPRQYVLISNGTTTSRRQNQNGTVTYRSVTGPMRDHVFVASSRYEVKTTQLNGVRVNIWYYRNNRPNPTAIAQAMTLTQKALTAFQKRYGVYPYRDLHIVQNPTLTGLEFPGLVIINEDIWQLQSNGLARIIIHEVGHQWFYGLVGNNQVEHPWLDEGLATYSELVYRLYYAKPEEAKQLTQAEQQEKQAFLTAIARKQLPNLGLNLPVADFGEFYGLFAYQHGKNFYLELETQLGRETVYRGLSRYVQQFRYEITTAADLKRTFELVSGRDLTPLFQQWVGPYEKDRKPAPVSRCQATP